MNFSLILVSEQSSDGQTVEGEWIQNVVACSLKQAIERAKRYELERPCYSVKIDVAVVTEVPSSVPQGVWTGLNRLDKSRKFS